MARKICAAVIACAGLSATSYAAGPVTYEGGVNIMEESDRESTGIGVNYTFDPNFAIGYRAEWDRHNDALLNGVRASALVKRWNGEDYQANVWAILDAGVATGIDDNPAGANPFVGGVFMADWENRRWYFSYMAHAWEAGDVGSNFAQMGRVGIAPYIGGSGDLHTWLMVEVDHRPDNDREIGVTPLVRLFKGELLFEFGWTVNDNRPLVNFIYLF